MKIKSSVDNLVYRGIDFFTPFLSLVLLSELLLDVPFNLVYIWLGSISGLLMLVSTHVMGGYYHFSQRNFARKLEIVLKSWVVIVSGMLFMTFLLGGIEILSRKVFLVWIFIAPLLMIFLKVFWMNFASFTSTSSVKALLIGEEYSFTELERSRLSSHGVLVEFFQSNNESNLASFVKNNDIQMIILNIQERASKDLTRTLTHLELIEGVKLLSINHFFEQYLRKCYIPYDVIGVDYLDNVKSFSSSQLLIKRFIDISFSVLMLLVLFPVIIYSVYRIKKESPGSVFFRQLRVGKKAKGFHVIKFRSMHENSYFNPYTQKEDARIFKYGGFMRKTRIDELPQLLNVVLGDMHLLGPRTEWDILVEEYEKEIPFYHERHLVRPGISGWAQVMYPYGSNAEDARQKLMYDLYYIKYWSLWLELETIVRTVGVILGRKGV